MSHLFPIFLKLEGRRCVLVGAGAVGSGKLAGLLECGAQVTAIDPSPNDQVRALANEGRIELHERRYEPGDLQGAYLAVIATSDPSVNEEAYADAQRLQVLANVVDVPPLCDFYYGANARRGHLVVSVSSEGQSPHLAQRVRNEIDAMLPAELANTVEQIGVQRREILKNYAPGRERDRMLRDLVYSADSPTAHKDMNHGV
jgi:siroheme synthase-like protein